MKIKIFLQILVFIHCYNLGAQTKLRVPSIKETHSLLVPSNPQISPNGQHVVFQTRSVDWEANRFDTEIWISKNGAKPFPLTNSLSSSSYDPKWSPNGEWISFLSYRGENTQIHVIRTDGGESFPAVMIDGNISSYDWSPDGSKFAFTMDQKVTPSKEATIQKFGNFQVDDADWANSWLYMIDFIPDLINQTGVSCFDEEQEDCLQWAKPEALIANVDFSISTFKWSPDGTKITFNKQPNSLINTYMVSDIGLLDVDKKTWEVLVNYSGSDFSLNWSPDSKSILYYTTLNDLNSNYYSKGHFFIISIDSKVQKEIAKDFDEELEGLTWTKNGIYAIAQQRTKANLFLIDPSKNSIETLSETPDRVYEFSISSDGTALAFLGEDDLSLKEIYHSSLSNYEPDKISDFSKQLNNWNLGTSEVISWKSKDGTIIEGVLHKPSDYTPDKQYPLFVIIHGGPTMTDRPTPIPAFYPAVQWLNKGALIFQPNYRGSGGYGEKFRSLNVGNLGIGDAWDVLSGIDYLDSLNIIDTTRMGCMGWSQGGYISAFLATSTNRFKAVSVGAGITNWKTHYSTTDLHPFTLQYLKSTPWVNPEIYAKTSPMTYINNASTPTLIQHSKNDQRVSIVNAYELLQGLRDMDVDTKLIIYDFPGHAPSKPKERLAGACHNLEWFGKYIFGEEIEIRKLD